MENALNQAKKLWSESASDVGALHEIRKITALGVACCEQHGVKQRTLGEIYRVAKRRSE